jgi:HPt (histidine-containing phosphotransfer) domain-containing protein
MAGPVDSAASDLRRYFAGRLPARVAEVEAARDAARDAGWAPEPLRTLHRTAHSLAGAGATFGFPEVTELARRLEALLAPALDRGEPPGEAARREVDDLLAGLRRIAHGAAGRAAGGSGG